MLIDEVEHNVVDLVQGLNYAEKVDRALRLIERAHKEFGDKLVVANSLGKDSSVIWHLAKRVSSDIRGFIVTTRFKPTETKQFMREEVGLDTTEGSLITTAVAAAAAKVAGLDTTETIAVAAVVGLFTYASYEADEAEVERARREAAEARERMQAAHLRALKAENVKLAVPANDEDGVMVVDPETGEPVDNQVHSPKEGEKPAAPGTVGELGEYSVVFTGPAQDSATSQ